MEVQLEAMTIVAMLCKSSRRSCHLQTQEVPHSSHDQGNSHPHIFDTRGSGGCKKHKIHQSGTQLGDTQEIQISTKEITDDVFPQYMKQGGVHGIGLLTQEGDHGCREETQNMR